jgi:transposase InsO family protein
MIAPLENKRQAAKKLGISRSSLYYRSKMRERDLQVKQKILAALSEHPSYGHRRLALHLGRNKKCILRVMKKYAIKPYRRRTRRPCKPGDIGKNPLAIANFAKTLCPLRRNVLWASDFTYFWIQGKFWYLCTVLDIFSREIIGFSFSDRHDHMLVLNALSHALLTHPAPLYLHTDQGSEYTCTAYFSLLKEHHIQASFSTKASPWQNGFQESFYSEFKKDLGTISRFETIGVFLEALYLQIHYYNTARIHTTLKTTPIRFKQHLLSPGNVS